MEALLILPLAGLVLPARYALRLGAVGIIALLALGIYGSTPLNPGVGHGLDEAIIIVFFLLLLGGVVAGLVARGVWNAWHGAVSDTGDLAVPPLLDNLLAALAMVVLAGLVALMLGRTLSGNAQPMAVHLGLLAGLAAAAIGALVGLRGLARAAVLGLSLWLAVIVVDSMRLDGQLRADAARVSSDRPRCLAVGLQGLPPVPAVLLMGLTAPKPIILHIAAPDGPQYLRWSFRWHGFVKGGISAADVHCTPALP